MSQRIHKFLPFLTRNIASVAYTGSLIGTILTFCFTSYHT